MRNNVVRRLGSVVLALCVVVATVVTQAPAAQASLVPVNHPVRGHFDTFSVVKNRIQFSAWAGDGDQVCCGTAAFMFSVSNPSGKDPAVTDRWLIFANTARPDVRRRYPELQLYTGLSGWRELPPGAHTVCLSAVGIGNPDVPLGCRSFVTTPVRRVFGHIDRFWTDPSDPTYFYARGWALDRDQPTATNVIFGLGAKGKADIQSITTRNYYMTGGATDIPRPDVLRHYPGFTSAAGFTVRYKRVWGYVAWDIGDTICFGENLYYVELTPYCRTLTFT